MLILEISYIVIRELCYYYIKSKYEEKTTLCYMDTDIFTAYIKTENIYVGIAKDVEKRFDTSNFELEDPYL